MEPDGTLYPELSIEGRYGLPQGADWYPIYAARRDHRHHAVKNEQGRLECIWCGCTWKKQPSGYCPQVKVYEWGKWDEHLLTKKQMDEAGYQTGKKLPSPAGAVYRKDSPGGIMWLYDRNQGVPKRVVSAEEKEQQAAKRKAAELCPVCKERSRVWVREWTEWGRRDRRQWRSKHGWWETCKECEDRLFLEGIRREVRTEAQALFAKGFLILDTETSGLEGEIIEIAVITHTGRVLLNTRIKPKRPEEIIESRAYDIHGIHPDDLKDAPTFPQVYDQLVWLLWGRRVVIYNAQFDVGRLEHDCGDWWGWGLPKLRFKKTCAMLMYSRWEGDYSEYWGDFKWQKLPGGDHSALGDCLATLRVMKEMAYGDELPADTGQELSLFNGW